MSFGWWCLILAATCAAVLMPAVISSRAFGRDHVDGVQTLHVAPTSRLGGVIVVLAYLVVVTIARTFDQVLLSAVIPLAAAAAPVVLVGLLEDLLHRVRPRYRLLAAVVSAALASAFAGGVVPRIDIAAVDRVLAFTWIALPLTWFMVAGACNAFNLIDGAHGLASGTALIMFGGIALAAGWSDDTQTLVQALAMIGALAGFLVWNYPRGRIFLGDSGAYFIGFMYAQLSIELVARNSGISPWFVVMLAGYPIVDTLFAMYRRGLVRRRPLMAPDALHLHSLIFRRVAVPGERRRGAADPRARGRYPLSAESMQRANGHVAPRLWLHSAFCFALAVVFRDNTPALWVGLLVYAALYVNRYRTLVRFGSRRARLAPGNLERTGQADPTR